MAMTSIGRRKRMATVIPAVPTGQKMLHLLQQQQRRVAAPLVLPLLVVEDGAAATNQRSVATTAEREIPNWMTVKIRNSVIMTMTAVKTRQTTLVLRQPISPTNDDLVPVAKPLLPMPLLHPRHRHWKRPLGDFIIAILPDQPPRRRCPNARVP